MKRIMKISLFALGSVLLVGLPGFVPGFPSLSGLQAVAQAATETTINLDVACDCRTFKFNRGIPFDQAVQGDGFLTKGKIFPAGTLPSGAATNDPNLPVNGVSSIGDWVCRGQLSGEASPPFLYFTQYHRLNDGRVLLSDGFDG